MEQLELSHVVAGKSQNNLICTYTNTWTEIYIEYLFTKVKKNKTRNYPNFHQKVNVKNKIIAYLKMEYSSAIEGVDEHTTG